MYRQNRNKKYLENLGQEENYCLTVDYYPGVDDEIFDLIKEIYKPDFVIKSEDVFYEKDELNKMMNPFLTEDRVRGVMYYGKMEEDGKELESDRIGIFLPFHHFESRMKKYMEMANGIGLACRGNIVDMLRKKS